MFLPTHECAFIEKCMDMAHGLQHVPHEQAGIQTLLRELGHIHSLCLQPHSAQVKTWGFRFYCWRKDRRHLDFIFLLRSVSSVISGPSFFRSELCSKALAQEAGRPEFFLLPHCGLWAGVFGTLGLFPQLSQPMKTGSGWTTTLMSLDKSHLGSAMCMQFLGIAINIYPNNGLWPPG